MATKLKEQGPFSSTSATLSFSAYLLRTLIRGGIIHPFAKGGLKNELVANAIECVELHAKSPVPSAAVSCENDTLPRSAWQTPICKVDTHLTFDG
jgi:sulfur carrier protein ThiS